jgi:hypothetical protein
MKTKAYLPQACVTLANFGYPVWVSNLFTMSVPDKGYLRTSSLCSKLDVYVLKTHTFTRYIYYQNT